MAKITPTEGRIVWFYGSTGAKRQAAIIAGVNDKSVELWVFNRAGSVYAGDAVVREILDPDQVPDTSWPYATWMPYQKAVASGALPPAVHA
jgi:hypothetical protein